MFAELHTKSHYSFLCGASSPQELVHHAHSLGYSAIAITDECSFAGVVKAYQASEECGLKLIIGSEFTINNIGQSLTLLLLAPNRKAYSEISALITRGRRRSPKGEYLLNIDDLKFGLQHCLAIWLPSSHTHDEADGLILKRTFKNRLWLGVELFMESQDQQHYLYCENLSAELEINMAACNDVHMHDKARKPLLDTLTAIRLKTSIQQLGQATQGNAEHHLKSTQQLKHQYPTALLEETIRIADLCSFSMNELQYEYPKELVPKTLSPSEHLRELTYNGANTRWPTGVPDKVRSILEYELGIIQELQYEYYFLTVYDIVAFARSKDILCQGRGSAANSAVCYCLYITEVDPNMNHLLFERFITKERNEPPDIDVDFESQRREEVIQYIYGKYSRKRTALTATVITYRRKSAVRDVGKALGLPLNFIEELNQSLAWWDKIDALTKRMQDQKLVIDTSTSLHFFKLVKEIIGVPRHLSQHVGGFLITHNPTSTLVPIENASMPDRTIIQWDKYDIEIMKLLKVDVLGLGMLSAIRRSLKMVSDLHNKTITVQDIPKEDSKVYDMLCSGDSVGVFQVESRAQISMLPRLRPRRFYDLVIEVAIVRPGPIQGDMVHPYLKRRNGEERVSYPNTEIKRVLERTLGIPIFQEQVIELTMVAAGFSGGEADQLRRAMASWGKNGDLGQFEGKLVQGMISNGHSLEFAQRLFQQIKGFGSYGFPESHSASFALLVYFSAWIKCHHPAAFYAGILNSQPMGFYSPSQLIQDARRHDVVVLPVCINNSDWEHAVSLINSNNQPRLPALRLGLQLVKGLSETSALAIMQSRSVESFNSVNDFKTRQLCSSAELAKLTNANAFHRLEDNRRQAFWDALLIDDGFKNQHSPIHQNKAVASKMVNDLSPTEELLSDYHNTQGVSLKYHPMQILRPTEPFTRCVQASALLSRRNNSLIEISGVVTGRQRPGTASGVIFMTLEDETGNINVILWKGIQERFKQEILTGKILYIKGNLEHQHGVANVIARYIQDMSHTLSALNSRSRNFH